MAKKPFFENTACSDRTTAIDCARPLRTKDAVGTCSWDIKTQTCSQGGTAKESKKTK